MSYYGGTVTVAGRNLITSLMAGKTIEFTRIMVGSGAMPEGVEPIDMVALVTPVAEGVSSVATVENGVLSMVVEYRNDLNGGLQEGFWLREFGVFAKTEDTEEILLYYATLGDSRSMPTRITALTFGAIPFRLPLSWMPMSRLPTTPARSSRPLRLRSWCGRWFRRRSAVSAPQSSKTSRFPIPAGHGRRRILVNRARGTWTSIATTSMFP